MEEKKKVHITNHIQDKLQIDQIVQKYNVGAEY